MERRCSSNPHKPPPQGGGVVKGEVKHEKCDSLGQRHNVEVGWGLTQRPPSRPLAEQVTPSKLILLSKTFH